MVETPSSSSTSSSCASFSSFDDVTAKSSSNNAVKFLCSYGGKILPRYPDGKLRYFGGDTRVLAVDRSVPFSELQAKMGELCGWGSVSVRCQLPTEDLDALVSITSDEDLANLIEEYDLSFNRDRANGPLKIRAFLHETPAKSTKSPSPPPASSSAVRSHRCGYHHHHRHQIRCAASSRFSGGRSATTDPRFNDGHHPQHQPHQQHRHHEVGVPRDHHYLVHH